MRPAEALPPHDPSAHHENQTLSRLAEIALALRSSTDFATLVDVVTSVLEDSYEAQTCRVFLIEERSGALRLWDPHRNQPGDPYIPPAGGVLATLLLREEPLFLTYPSADAPQPDPDLWQEGSRAVVALPLTTGGDLHGVLVAMLATARPFSPADRVLFGFLADALAVSLERGRRRRDLDGVRDQVQQIESEAEEREALLGQMLSVVAHEMRTPLTAIKAYAEALIDAPEETWENRTPFLEIINEECDRLGRMIANALDYSRLESGQRSLRLATLAPVDLMGDVVMTLTPEGEKRNVKVEHEVPEDFGFVEGDPDLLKQLCMKRGDLASRRFRSRYWNPGRPAGEDLPTVLPGGCGWCARGAWHRAGTCHCPGHCRAAWGPNLGGGQHGRREHVLGRIAESAKSAYRGSSCGRRIVAAPRRQTSSG
jgi:signal transduction histidine kinase